MSERKHGDLISREALKKDLQESYAQLKRIYETLHYSEEKQICSAELCVLTEAILRVKDAPAVDAVEVVRCRERKHRYSDSWCEYVDDDDNFYCARGERKEGAN